MRALARILRRRLSLLSVFLLLGMPVASAAGPSVVADFDGDGLRDHAELCLREPSQIHIWLSGTQRTWTLRSATPILSLAASDLDGDRKAELIASGPSAGLQIWTGRRGRLTPFHSRRGSTATHFHDKGHSVDYGPDEAPAADAGQTSAPPIALALSPAARAPALVPARASTRSAAHSDSARVLAPLAPRPPPLAH